MREAGPVKVPVKPRAPRKSKYRDDYGRHVDNQKLTITRKHAAQQLPGDWLGRIDTEARAAGRVYGTDDAPRWVWSAIAAREVWQGWINEYGGVACADLSDAQIKERATLYEREARDLDMGEVGEGGPWAEYWRIMEFCQHRGVHAPGPSYLLSGIAARVRCRYWWRRALRREVARKAERGAMVLGIVSKPNYQPYASNKSVWRRLDQNKRNRETLERTMLENEDGQRATLADLAARSVARKSVRRGELMTRIRGCEEMADAAGHVGVFLTLTCPSRYHCTTRNGQRNPKHDGSSPRDAQQWLCKMWARARAELKRQSIDVYGFRVAEPHHDGCTHWHGLLWCSTAKRVGQLIRVLRKYWLSDAGDEDGAQKVRMTAKRMRAGGAAGYIAKYISKNIDDHAIGEHLDDYADGPITADLLGDLELTPSMRVEAWASTWGIRQFQAIGQPPVTVWRELRRVTEATARGAGVGGIVHRAWVAVQGPEGVSGAMDAATRARRVESGGRASWAAYCQAQGGVMAGRAYKVALATDSETIKSRYGECVRKTVRGVRLNWAGSRCIYSERRAWRPVEPGSEFGIKGILEAKPNPWTRVNNCTTRIKPGAHNRLRARRQTVIDTEVRGDLTYYRALEAERIRAGRVRDVTRH